jgi:hypothetical protein
MRRLACDRGEVGLTALLAGMTIMLAVGGAVLTTFDLFVRGDRQVVRAADDQQAARAAIELLSRELRSLASPTTEQPQAVDRVGPYDLVFQTVHPGLPAGSNTTGAKRVRYCLPAAGGLLHVQTQTWTTSVPPAVPADTSCPGSGWTGGSTVAAQHLTNRTASPATPAFVTNSMTLTDVSAVHVDLVVDRDPADDVDAARISSGVFLRNQNRRPVAAFSATRTPQGIVLNGSASSDPEGQPLTYEWFSGTTAVGTGLTLTMPATSGTTYQLSLRVSDPAGLETTAATQALTA